MFFDAAEVIRAIVCDHGPCLLCGLCCTRLSRPAAARPAAARPAAAPGGASALLPRILHPAQDSALLRSREGITTGSLHPAQDSAFRSREDKHSAFGPSGASTLLLRTVTPPGPRTCIKESRGHHNRHYLSSAATPAETSHSLCGQLLPAAERR